MIRLKVKEVAERKKVSQTRLSRLADVDIKTLRRVYRMPDSANIRLETLNRLAYALKVHVCDLLEYERDAALPGIQDDEELSDEPPEKP
jgi:DNA-binding Xre family transcriptional regulator